MPTEFTYLVRRDRRGENVSCVEDVYTRKNIAARLVVRDEQRNKYLVFENRDELLAWYRELPETKRSIHEVIFGYRPQHLKFDIDAKVLDLDAIPSQQLKPNAVAFTDDELGTYLADILQQGEHGAPAAAQAPAAVQMPASAEQERGAARQSKIRAIVDLLIEAILDELHDAYYGIEDISPTRESLVVTDSSGQTEDGWKYSYHVLVLPYAVANNDEAAGFTERVVERLPELARAFIDMGVNKSTQNFRMLGSSKPRAERYKRATAAAVDMFKTARNVDPAHMLVTAAPGTRVLACIYAEDAPLASEAQAQAQTLTAQNPLVQSALNLAEDAGVLAGHVLASVRGTLMCFTREAPSYCALCRETHHHDNSLMLGINLASEQEQEQDAALKAYRVVELCRQARGRSRLLGTITGEAMPATRGAQLQRPAATFAGQVAKRVAGLHQGSIDPHAALASEFEQLASASKTVYEEPAMRDYELTPTLAVLAQMKLGKTKAIRRYIDAHFPPEGLAPPVIRFVTFRQTFGRALSEDFPDFVLYSSVAGDLDPVRHPRLIVQVESLHRLKMPLRPEPVDLLVLDEVESVLAQFSSNLHKHFTAAFAIFKWMLATARHVVCMDANLGTRTFRTLARMRPAHPPHFHWNRYARAADDTYYFTTDQAAWLERLHAYVRADKRVVIPTNSLAEAKTLDACLRTQFPQKRAMLYSSETAPSEKARHFGDVHRYWAELDILIYTPTCSAGVSFELDHFDALFGFFCDTSCDVETCRQMSGRVRNLRSGEHFICLRATGAALPATSEDIQRMVYDKRAGLYRLVEDAALQYDYAPDGSIRYYESDYFYLWLETTRLANLSRNAFAARFIDQVADTGASIAMLAAPDDTAGSALLTSHRELRAELRTARHNAVADASDLYPEEAGHIREALQAQQDVAPADKLAYEKFLLCEAFSWHGRAVDASFVENYQPLPVRRVYRNLLRIAEGPSMVASLEAIRQREAAHYMYSMDSRDAQDASMSFVSESRDLLREKRTFVFNAHYLATWLLRLCGFVCITDKNCVHESLLETRLRGALPALLGSAEKLVFEFEIKSPSFGRLANESDPGRFIAGMLRTINAVLRAMYGVHVRKVPDPKKVARGRAYRLDLSAIGRLFDFPGGSLHSLPVSAPRPHIPSNLTAVSINPPVVFFLESVYYDSAAANVDAGCTDVDLVAADADLVASHCGPPPARHDARRPSAATLLPSVAMLSPALAPAPARCSYTLDDVFES
jgi:hypothetical protein